MAYSPAQDSGKSRQSFDFSQSLGFGEEREMKDRRKPEKSSTLNDFDDKYSAFSRLDKTQCSKGWSGKVLVGQAGPYGWSDEVLGAGSEDEIETEPHANFPMDGMSAVAEVISEDNLRDGADGVIQQDRMRPQSLTVEEGAWQLSLHRRTTWDRSPNRSFVRNFP